MGKNFSNNKELINYLKRQTLQEWETTQVLFQAALQSKYLISQSLINAVLLQIPAFRSVGHFSVKKFYNVLHTINCTKLQFLTDIKKTSLINQVRQGITQSAFALPQDVSNYIKYTQQKRDFAYLIIPYVRFLHQQFKILDSKILAYYLKHKSSFSQPALASIEYIEFSSMSEKIFLEYRDKLANLTYVHPDSLALAANKLRLSVYSTGFFGRRGGKEKLSRNPKIIAAAFSEDVLQGNNSLVININRHTAVVLRIKQYQTSSIRPFNQVKEKIKDILTQKMAISTTYQYGESLFKKLEKTGSIPKSFASKWQFIHQVNRYNDKLNRDIIKVVFTLVPPNKNIPTFLSMRGFSLKNGDYVLVKLLAVHDKKYKSSDFKQDLYREAIAENFGELDYSLYKRNLLRNAKLIQYSKENLVTLEN